MTEPTNKTWSSNYLFLMASIGSTVGLSNIWRFTYLAGENGGGAFVLIYLLSLVIMGVPILAAEMVIGKRGGKSMVGTMEVLYHKDKIQTGWKYFGWVAMITVFLILSFYSVIAGWTLDYTVTSLAGLLNHLNSEDATAFYQQLLDSPFRIMIGQGIFVLATVWIVAKGVKEGLEKSISWMMPTLFVILLLLVVYGMIYGKFMEALRFLFAPDFSKITPQVVLAAFGQAFFSLGIGVGVMLTYGAYMPPNTNVIKSAAIIAFSDGIASMLAGLAIFPIVFQYGLSPAEGPGLIFITLPVTFGDLPGGGFIGSFFFLLLFFAALTSSISLLESIISHLEETIKSSRARITIVSGIVLWLVGLGTVFSFNYLSDFTPLDFISVLKGKTIFGLLDYFGSNLLMPVGGILMAILAGWILSKEVVFSDMNLTSRWQFIVWRFLVKFVAPLFVLALFIYNL
ncbi:MAG TPA: sodium-dependent transporter [Cyclobacteriaceae bacterium]|nr:sodium-dependent transporter [Cyclobacteriaceae bacterium]HPW62519.1 sodium-dependent transporter [Cyclobacteriaceae bacterium]